jgi:hypothetical protein
MKMKTRIVLFNFFFALLMILPFPCYVFSAQSVTGEITSSIILQERIYLNTGDKAVTNLGSKDGVIKGDILIVTTRLDVMKEKPIGQCAVTSVDVKSSICEIITSNMEIPQGSNVSIPVMYYTMEQFYPAIYKILSKSVDPFPPYEKVKISVYDIFDNQNNITKFSDRVKQEMKEVFAEKKRVKLVEPKTVKKDFFLYPEDIRNSYGLRTEVMETLGVDVFITGSYTLNNENAIFTFYKFDKNFNDEKITFQVPLTSIEAASAKEITAPYKPIPKKEYIPCTVAFIENHYMPQKEEKRDIIGHEAGRNIYKAYDLRKTNFNIISPSDFVFKMDDQPISFSGKTEAPILLTKGTHKLFASFKRGYFFNTRDPRLYVSDKPLEKEAILTVEKDASIYIEVVLNSSFEGENIDFKIYNVSEKKTQLLKTIIKTEATKAIELFKD